MLCHLPSPSISPSTSAAKSSLNPSPPPPVLPRRSLSRRTLTPLTVANAPLPSPALDYPSRVMRPRTAGLPRERPIVVVPLRRQRTVNDGGRRNAQGGSEEDGSSKENGGRRTVRTKRSFTVDGSGAAYRRDAEGIDGGFDVDVEVERLATRSRHVYEQRFAMSSNSLAPTFVSSTSVCTDDESLQTCEVADFNASTMSLPITSPQPLRTPHYKPRASLDTERRPALARLSVVPHQGRSPSHSPLRKPSSSLVAAPFSSLINLVDDDAPVFQSSRATSPVETSSRLPLAKHRTIVISDPPPTRLRRKTSQVTRGRYGGDRGGSESYDLGFSRPSLAVESDLSPSSTVAGLAKSERPLPVPSLSTSHLSPRPLPPAKAHSAPSTLPTTPASATSPLPPTPQRPQFPLSQRPTSRRTVSAYAGSSSKANFDEAPPLPSLPTAPLPSKPSASAPAAPNRRTRSKTKTSTDEPTPREARRPSLWDLGVKLKKSTASLSRAFRSTKPDEGLIPALPPLPPSLTRPVPRTAGFASPNPTKQQKTSTAGGRNRRSMSLDTTGRPSIDGTPEGRFACTAPSPSRNIQTSASVSSPPPFSSLFDHSPSSVPPPSPSPSPRHHRTRRCRTASTVDDSNSSPRARILRRAASTGSVKEVKPKRPAPPLPVLVASLEKTWTATGML